MFDNFPVLAKKKKLTSNNRISELSKFWIIETFYNLRIEKKLDNITSEQFYLWGPPL